MPTTKIYPRNIAPARAALKDRGISGYRLAKTYGLPPSQVSQVLAGRLTPAKPVADAVMAETGMAPEDLFDLELLLHTRWYPATLAQRLQSGGDIHER